MRGVGPPVPAPAHPSGQRPGEKPCDSRPTRWALTVGTERPATLVHHVDTDSLRAGDTGFLVVFTDAPWHADELDEDDPRWGVMCLDCLLEEGPELGQALELAREHGWAERDPDTGDWRTSDDG